MPLVWCSISGHGFGHAAQLVPVLNELGRRVPELKVILRTTVSKTFFDETLLVPWEYSWAQQDIGCVQDGPLCIDIPKTWEAYEHFHAGWATRVSEETSAIRAHNPNLVLSNVSHLSIASGIEAKCPTVAMGSLSWDQVLAEYVDEGCSEQETIIEQIRQAYQGAQILIRPYPGIRMAAFPEVLDVGPILSPIVASQKTIRGQLNLGIDECLVLVAFGGIPLDSLPLGQIDRLTGYRFLISGNHDCRGYSRIISTDSIGMSFRQILAEADIVITKPGYATVVEAVRLHMPIVYVRRYNFIDEQPLVDFAHRYGRATELTVANFESGQWGHALESVQLRPYPMEPMPSEGTGSAVDQLLKVL